MKLYKDHGINPLAGCLPSLAQIPVFLGVYYSVTSIAKAQVYSEGFLWLPSLSGPIADRSQGLSWLTERRAAPGLARHAGGGSCVNRLVSFSLAASG